MQSIKFSLLVSTLLICISFTRAQVVKFGDVGSSFSSDHWVSTDALGRELPTYDEVGGLRSGKLVGMFYYIWHGAHGDKVYDINKLLKENPDNPAWGPKGKFHFWGEPEYGYYRSEDPWVIRHDMQMLANAGIDFIFFDVTNARAYLSTVKQLCEVCRKMRKQGIHTPEIAFLTNSRSGRVMNQVYDEIYSKGLYKELWFYWQGKPLIMGKTDDEELRPEVRDFFNIKRSWAWTKTKEEPNHWQWLDRYPQDYGWSESRSIPEQITVSTAHHPGNPYGKSYHDGAQPEVNDDYLTEFTDMGLQFAEQWERAHEVDPQVVMVTQWNEWLAQRFIWDGTRPKKSYAGHPIKKGDSHFVDVFTREFNRDIAPMKDGYTDNYYYQLIANVRKFKGMEKPQAYSKPATINIDGGFIEWENISPVYYDHEGDTEHRNFKGYDPNTTLANETGRNDIIESRVSCDEEFAYFYVKTKDELTKPSDNWMLLFIDADQDKSTGWEGYDYVVNHGKVSTKKSTIKKWDGTQWSKVEDILLALRNTQMELRVPKKLLQGNSFDFHWADNPQQLNDISAFFLDGDSAPDRRFNYRFAPKGSRK